MISDAVSAVQRLVGPLALLLLWGACSALGANPALLPSPANATSRLVQLLSTHGLWVDAADTGRRWWIGYLAGCVAGVPIGLALGQFPPLYRSSEFVLEFMRALPVTAVFPLFLMVFGIGDASKIAMVFTGTVFVVTLNAAYGVLNSTRQRVRMAEVFGATRGQVFRWVLLYEALPQVLLGMRSALSLSLIVVIVSEMFIGTRHGLGQRIFDTYQQNATADLYALLVLIGLLGYAANRVFLAIERRVVFWAGQ